MAPSSYYPPEFLLGFESWWSNQLNEASSYFVQPELHLPVLAGWGSLMIAYWVYGGLLLIVDVYRTPDCIYDKRYQPNRHYAFKGSDWNPPFFTMLRHVLSMQIFIVLPGVYAMQWACLRCSQILPWKLGIQLEPQLTPLQYLIPQVIFSAILLEILFYYTHRLFHHPKLYAKIHKKHHEYRSTHALAAMYASPIEVLFGNTFAVLAPPFILGFRILPWIVACVIGILASQTDHAGYHLPWDLAYQTPGFHDYHHEKFNVNYGVLEFMDRFHGTDKMFRDKIAQENQKQKKKE